MLAVLLDIYFMEEKAEEGSREKFEVKFLVLGEIVDSGIGLSYRPAGLHRLAGRYNNPMPVSTLSPNQGLRIWLLFVERAPLFPTQEMARERMKVKTSSMIT